MSRPTVAAATAALVILAAGAARADEGMWPFDEAPVAQVKDALGVTLDSPGPGTTVNGADATRILNWAFGLLTT